MRLCRIQAIRDHPSRTEQYGLNCRDVFISMGWINKVSTSTITFWIRASINIAYRMASEEDYTEVRSIGSLLFKKNFAVNQAMEAGT